VGFLFTPQVPAAVTNGVRVEVEALFLPEQSDLVEDRYVFAYRIVITNQSDHTVQLMRRHWLIHDGSGGIREVEGEGVVGEQPVLEPGSSHEYTSGAVLESPSGTMKGTYEMHRQDGSVVEVTIPEFQLRMPRTLH
jgi:ApaG protein